MGISARHVDFSGLKRLTQRVEDWTLEFGQLVEKQHAQMGEAHLAGAYA